MMMRSLILSVWAVLLCSTAAAQSVDDDRYYPYAEREEERPLPAMDPSLFHQAIRSAEDCYTTATQFALPEVTIHRRGEGYEREQSTLFGIETPYRHATTWRLLGFEEEQGSGLHFTAEGIGTTGGVRRFQSSDAEPLEPLRVVARYAERNYRFGAQLTYRKRLKRGSLLSLAADYRTGRDAQIEGVFTNALRVGGAWTKEWSRGVRWEVAADLPLSMRGMRAATSEEAMRLTDDVWYNPAWGYQDGKERSARVRREVLPMVVTTVTVPIRPLTTLQLTAAAEAGVRKQSALGWYDARTPLPDNYRKLPSYTEDRATEEVWLMDDPRYTQINWDELITVNRIGEGEAAYALEDRVTSLRDLQLRAALQSEWGRVRLDYGLQWRGRTHRHYKELRDLLGADFLTDIDQYLIDDDHYANRLENNLRNPSRRITEGDRFGYDYALIERQTTAWINAAWQNHRWSARAALALERHTICREGFYEKELFPDRLSYGRSRTIEALPYTLKGAFGYTPSPRDYAGLHIAFGSRMPSAEHLFIQPLYNNRTVETPDPERFYAAQLNYRRTGEQLDWQLSAFATIHLDGTRTQRYFDDLSGAYADLTATEIGTSAVGLEAAAVWRIDYHWTLTAAASWGSYRYNRNPKLTIVTDTDNRPIDQAATAYMGDCRVGGAPETTAVLQAGYYNSGWSLRLSTGWAGGRYVDPTFLRRTDRVARQNGTTPEAFTAFVDQEQLPDALTLDLACSKSFRFAQSQLTLFLSIRNLLGAEMISYGYESLRTQRAGITAESLRLPQATRYLYASPRSVLVTVGYRF